LVPQDILGTFYSRRLALSAVAAIAFALLGAIFVDYWQDQTVGTNQILGYTWVLLSGALLFGLTGSAFMARMPEPLMAVPPPGTTHSLIQAIKIPLTDRNFRQLVNFLFFWGFAVNLAVPFFTVYMLQRLGFPLGTVIGLNILTQAVTVMFLRVWGPMADKFGSKVVLSLSASLYVLVILGWVFTTMPDRYFLTVPLIVTLQIFAGVAAAGINLTVATIGLKLAPRDQATTYMTVASLATALGAGLGPLAGGIFADIFSVREFNITFEWISPAREVIFSPLNLTGFDFLFSIAFVVGLITLNALTTIREEGEAGREEVLNELLAPSREMTRILGAVPGMRFVGALPYSYLKRMPGMDVALGITAYQLGSSARQAMAAATRGGTAAAAMTEHVRNIVNKLVSEAEETGEYGMSISRQATRRTLHAMDGFAGDTGMFVRRILLGVFNAMGQLPSDYGDIFVGAAYGAVEGAGQADSDLKIAAVGAVAGAMEAASELGLPEEQAGLAAALGAIAAAQAISLEAEEQVREALDEMKDLAEEGPASTSTDR